VLVRPADLDRALEVLNSAARPQEGDNIEVVLREIAKRASGRPAVLALFAGLNREAIDNAVWTVASESGRELERFNLAAVVSKYVGETEKNLNRIFADAERAGAVLVFDEADALFGRETTKDGAIDGAWLVEFLARRKEKFAGAVVVTASDGELLDARLRKHFDYVLTFASRG
jgi:AAA+ superfamily predicted ATPase